MSNANWSLRRARTIQWVPKFVSVEVSRAQDMNTIGVIHKNIISNWISSGIDFPPQRCECQTVNVSGIAARFSITTTPDEVSRPTNLCNHTDCIHSIANIWEASLLPHLLRLWTKQKKESVWVCAAENILKTAHASSCRIQKRNETNVLNMHRIHATSVWIGGVVIASFGHTFHSVLWEMFWVSLGFLRLWKPSKQRFAVCLESRSFEALPLVLFFSLCFDSVVAFFFCKYIYVSFDICCRRSNTFSSAPKRFGTDLCSDL